MHLDSHVPRRSRAWERPQEGSSGTGNSKCKGPEVRYILGIVRTRPGCGKWESGRKRHSWRFVRGKGVEGFEDAHGEAEILSAFDGQSVQMSRRWYDLVDT